MFSLLRKQLEDGLEDGVKDDGKKTEVRVL
jgi:hypothetical protein